MTAKMRMYQTKLSSSESCIHTDASDVICEIAHVLPEMSSEDTFTITVVEMTQEEYDNLEDFEGY